MGYSNINIGNNPTLNVQYPGIMVNQTAAIATSGTYYLSASVLLDIDSGDTGGDFCFITTANTFPATDNYGGSGLTGGYQAGSMTDIFFIEAGDSAQVWCYDASTGDALSTLYDSNLTATLINSASDAKPRHSKKVLPPGTSERK